jgi:hypothetical protein
MRNYFYSLVTAISLLAGTTTASAQVDTINFKKGHQLNTNRLKPGLKQYLVYFQQPKQQKSLRFWYWLRDIKTGTRNGQPVFNISQHWFGPDTLSYRVCYSVNSAANFAPLYHMETITGKTKAYNWSATKMTGADTVATNLAKTFTLDFTEPNFNWNLDIETFEMLPLAAGKTFAINFYDAGLSQPKYVLYKVTGSEVLTLLDGTKTDCWILAEEGKSPDGSTYTETFWISKKGHEFLKEEDKFSGMYRYKIKMPGAAPDLMKRF